MGLGRIGLQDKGKDYDMAMIKILKPAKWAFAKMAPSTELKINQPVVSISYPGAFFKQKPNVRFGRISDVDLSDGFIESSAKMEPGDSGGPLFDALGRVVGIHSWIKEKEEQNFDVPAEHFLKYWTALNVAKDYTSFPAADVLPARVSSVQLQTVPALEQVVNIPLQNRKSAVMLTSLFGAKRVSISGTLINFKGDKYIVSKSSMVGNSPMIKSGAHMFTAKLLKRDREHDLVLLRTDGKMRMGINLSTHPQDRVLNQSDLGKILVSSLGNDATKVGVLSATYFDVLLSDSYGYLGASAVYQNGKITITGIDKSGPAASSLKLKDQVVKINSTAVSTAADYNQEFAKYLAGDSISIDILREGKDMQLSFYLQGQPTPHHASFEYSGGRSGRSDGFKNVLVHDAAIKAAECGSPVFDSEGTFYGVNIARRSRTSTLLLPAVTIFEFIKKSIDKR